MARVVKMRDMAGELVVGCDRAMLGLASVRWYPMDEIAVREFLVDVRHIHRLVWALSAAHDGKAVKVWFRRAGRAEARGYLVGKVLAGRVEGNTKGKGGGKRRGLGADWEVNGHDLGTVGEEASDGVA